MDFPELDLKKKVGPLPVQSWLTLIGLAAAAIYLLKRGGLSPAGADSGPAVDPLAVPPIPATPYTGGGSLDPVTPISSPTGTPQTNDAWAVFAASTLHTLRRPWSPTVILNALGRWLSGLSLDTEQRMIVDDAIKQAGYPPEGVGTEPDPVPASPVPGTTGTPGYERTPPALVPKGKLGTRRTRVGRGAGGKAETPVEIARRVYSSMIYVNYVKFFNASVYKSPNTPLPADALIAY